MAVLQGMTVYGDFLKNLVSTDFAVRLNGDYGSITAARSG